MLVRPWNSYDLGLPDFADDAQNMALGLSPRRRWMTRRAQKIGSSPSLMERMSIDLDARALKLIARLGQPFSVLLLAQQHSES